MAGAEFIKKVEEHAHKIGVRDGMSDNEIIAIMLADLYRLQAQIDLIVERLSDSDE
jgi:hypothetical protein